MAKPMPKAIYAAVMERDGGCQANGYGYWHRCAGPLVVHHRRLRSQGGQHTPENLVVLCEAAHLHVHANPTESYENGLLLRMGTRG